MSKLGYIVEYNERFSIGDIGSTVQVICTNKRLSEMLLNSYRYMIWSAKLIDIEEYQKNNREQLIILKSEGE